MSKWTPGPWEIQRNSKGYPYGITAPEQDPHRPGGIVDITRWASISCPSLPEGEANARLIAAAPDLLEALKLLESHVRIVPPEYDAAGSVLAQVSAAIAKAEGEDNG